MDTASHQQPIDLDDVVIIENDPSPDEQPPSKRIKLEPGAPTTDDFASASKVVAAPSMNATSNEPKYCSICDIKFTYLNTYLAHKQYYCKAAAAAKASNAILDTAAAAVAPSVVSVSPQPTALASLQ